ncbi:MAG: acyltransferase [Burkholderiales bacterium]|nr:acyltransferase [Burkholderiales bacterium]
MAEPKQGAGRLLEVDALRGLAAMAVVLFHYTTHFATLYAPATRPALSLPVGHFGVNLFFIISGFVIFMTLERTREPMDFVVSRFSRLFPAYWLAVLLTFTITHALGLPQKLVSAQAALGNVVMIHNLFGVPHVDGVYWTLEVELMFYAGMFTLYRLRRLDQVHLALGAMLALRIAYHLGQRLWGVDLLPWTLYRILIVQFLPWFTLGIATYLWLQHADRTHRRRAAGMAVAALLTLALTEGLGMGLLALALAGAVFAAASGALGVLRLRPLVWLGAISYPLYLVHENIGWSVLLRLHAAGIEANLAVLLTLALALALAHAVHVSVEMPAMRWLRQRYRQRRGKP